MSRPQSSTRVDTKIVCEAAADGVEHAQRLCLASRVTQQRDEAGLYRLVQGVHGGRQVKGRQQPRGLAHGGCEIRCFDASTEVLVVQTGKDRRRRRAVRPPVPGRSGPQPHSFQVTTQGDPRVSCVPCLPSSDEQVAELGEVEIGRAHCAQVTVTSPKDVGTLSREAAGRVAAAAAASPRTCE